MFDIGWSELLVIAVIAIVVVGPRELPRMMRNVGRYVGKAKSMARDFQSQFDDVVRDTEFEDMRKTIGEISSASPANSIKGALNPFTDVADDLKKTMDMADTPASPSKPSAAAPTKTAKKAKKPAAKKSAAKKTPAKKAKTAKKPTAASAPQAKQTGQRKPAAKRAKAKV
ncbi:MAG: Sec-independent protein translocase protein TatB [Alphaproteobacteria bacterium]